MQRGGGRGGDVRPVNGNRGMDHDAWVASGCPISGPKGWTQYQTEDGEKYYHNSIDNTTTWEAPDCWPRPP